MYTNKKKEALNLLQILEEEGHEARLVGGCVRDELLGLEPKDYDIATSASPEEMIAILRKRKMRYLVYGQEHGTITALMPSGSFEMTTLREDLKTFGRKAEVAFHKDFSSDACRRDFTINAMSQDRKGKVFDYFEGRKHLQEKRIVFVGDPVVRIQEDYLRILRFFRFKSRFALQSDQVTVQAMTQQVGGLDKVSHERITHEFDLIYKTPVIRETLVEMLKTGVLAFVIPSFAALSSATHQQCLDLMEKLAKIPVDFRFQARLTVVFILLDAQKVKNLESFILEDELASSRLRLPNKDKQVVQVLFHAVNQLPKLKLKVADHLLWIEALEKNGQDLFLTVIVPFLKVFYETDAVCLQKLTEVIHSEEVFGFRRKSLPIDGQDLIKEFHYKTGPKLGKALEALRIAYLDGEWQNKAEGLAWLQKQEQT